MSSPATASATDPAVNNSQRVKWWTPTLFLENTGNVARDHLASERTFLAYLRTSLAFASAAVALVQLLTLTPSSPALTHTRHFARPLGAATLLLALFVLLIGATRYFRVQVLLTQGKFPAARVSPAILAGMLGGLVAVVFAVLVRA